MKEVRLMRGSPEREVFAPAAGILAGTALGVSAWLAVGLLVALLT
jgi:hypothetical protein